MIERFNLYDVYGYLIPGLVALGCGFLPFFLVKSQLPQVELTSALAAVLVGYVVGHLLQALALTVVPSKFARSRYPSDIFLDANDQTFSLVVKTQIREQVKKHLGIELKEDDTPQLRKDTFSLCRRILLQKKITSYSEHFEGLYAMNRGLLAAFIVSSSYHFGWSTKTLTADLTFLDSGWVLCVTRILAILAVLFLVLSNIRRFASRQRLFVTLATISILVIVFYCGHVLAFSRVADELMRMRLFYIAAAEISIAPIYYFGYRRFAEDFAKVVYSDFLALSLHSASFKTTPESNAEATPESKPEATPESKAEATPESETVAT